MLIRTAASWPCTMASSCWCCTTFGIGVGQAAGPPGLPGPGHDQERLRGHPGAGSTGRWPARRPAATWPRSSRRSTPVTDDLERWFLGDPRLGGRHSSAGRRAGLAGCSVDEFRGRTVHDRSLAAARVEAAAEAAHRALVRLLLMAWAENHLRDRPGLADTIDRLRTSQQPGAAVPCSGGGDVDPGGCWANRAHVAATPPPWGGLWRAAYWALMLDWRQHPVGTRAGRCLRLTLPIGSGSPVPEGDPMSAESLRPRRNCTRDQPGPAPRESARAQRRRCG